MYRSTCSHLHRKRDVAAFGRIDIEKPRIDNGLPQLVELRASQDYGSLCILPGRDAAPGKYRTCAVNDIPVPPAGKSTAFPNDKPEVRGSRCS